jgi:hypothetical protein
MTKPKNFTSAGAPPEPFKLDPSDPNRVLIYRFGDRNNPSNWQSGKRKSAGGDFPMPSDDKLNDFALKQTSFGFQSDEGSELPFLSVATDIDWLKKNGESWVEKLLAAVPDYGTFSVPFKYVYRPSVTKSISKQETEWLYYDGEKPISHSDWKPVWQPNPFRK